MKKLVILFSLLTLIAGVVLVVGSESDVDKAAIEAAIEKAYINGAFNALDTESMRNGFHPTFRIHGVNDGELSQYPIDEWVKAIEKRKAAADFDPADQKWDHKIAFVDSTGPAAVAKIELFKDSVHVYTDYLSLMKLSNGWIITDKVYHRHPES